MTSHSVLHALAARTQEIYDKQAEVFDRDRSKCLFERPWMQRFQALLPEDASILDVGCGTADPIAAFFIAQGYALTGVDFSTSMLAIAQKRFPDGDWRRADMRTMSLGQSFDGILAWHSFFHLTQNDQRIALHRFAQHLAPGGVLMLTAGPSAGECTGHVGDELVYHASLSQQGYAEALAQFGISVVDFVSEDPDCGYATVLLAQRL